MNKYYNESAFQYAIDLLENDPFHAKLRFKAYIEKYPKDYYARAYYALLLTRLCEFDEAEAEYDYIKIKSQNDHFYICNQNDLRGFHYNMILVKMKILAYHEKYQELLDFIYKNRDQVHPEDIKYISYYCRIRLGIIDKNIETSSYRFLQTYNYNEKLFQEHIKKHLKSHIDDVDKPSGCVFNEDFPIEKVIAEIKKYIPSDKKLFPGYFDNTYFFKYDSCGMVDGTRTNYFTVVCFQNTSNFITLYPTLDCDKLPYVDLNYIRDLEEDKSKVKRLSQIDKFNMRYNRK